MRNRIAYILLLSGLLVLYGVAAGFGGSADARGVRETTSLSAGNYSKVDYLLHFEPVVDGLHDPVGITHVGDSRLFIWQRHGFIRILDENFNILPTPFLDISDIVDNGFWEQGLLGLAFHPDYAQNRYFYVNYTNLLGNTIVARYQTSAADPNVADPNSGVVIMEVFQPMDAHNGGDMHFGADGYLYIALGDGGGEAGLPNPQDGQSLLGKMLRIDVEGGFPYGIPPDNPFVNDPDVRDEIYLMGLRNPWRFSFDRQTHDLYWGNVGGAWYEEVEYKAAGDPAGGNYGWPCYEGLELYQTDYCPPETEFIFPITGFDNPEEGCAVIGGYVYRGGQYPEMVGDYLFADLCSGQIWRAGHDGNGWRRQPLQRLNKTISSFAEDPAGELYVIAFNNGIIYRLEAVPPVYHYLPQTMR